MAASHSENIRNCLQLILNGGGEGCIIKRTALYRSLAVQCMVVSHARAFGMHETHKLELISSAGSRVL
jgi:hypothetical protein